MTTGSPTLRLGSRHYPIVLPSLRDPRLHLAGVIISIHVLGQTVLGFRVSVPQILSAIVTCAVIEVVWSFWRSRQLIWPASAMLTGSGVALILRLAEAERGDPWTWDGWHLFAVVAGFSLLTKYLVRFRGTHVFNPSNVGLVVAFLVLGSSRIEPLDFWWAPFGVSMAAAYSIILVGGLVIASRLGLLAMALTYWVALAAGLGVVVASGHCMTAAWALAPVCGGSFWWILMTSPEVLIFLFFMITDPKTIPASRAARVVFAVAIAVVSTLLIAPQTTEFGAKVGLLAGLTLMSPLRGVFDRLFDLEPDSLWARLVSGTQLRPSPIFIRGGVLGSVIMLVAVVIVVVGAPARQRAQAAVPPAPDTMVQVDPATLPTVSIDPGVMALNGGVDAASAPAIALTLAENLAVEAEARFGSDPSLLRTVDHGARLIFMERRIEEDAVAKRRILQTHTFDSLHLRTVFPDGTQSGPSLGFDAAGTVVEVTYDESGRERSRASAPFSSTFVLNQAAGVRWLIVDVLDSRE